MVISYDERDDTLHITFSEALGAERIELARDVDAELDEKGNVIGIDVWSGAREKCGLPKIEVFWSDEED